MGCSDRGFSGTPCALGGWHRKPLKDEASKVALARCYQWTRPSAAHTTAACDQIERRRRMQVTLNTAFPHMREAGHSAHTILSRFPLIFKKLDFIERFVNRLLVACPLGGRCCYQISARVQVRHEVMARHTEPLSSARSNTPAGIASRRWRALSTGHLQQGRQATQQGLALRLQIVPHRASAGRWAGLPRHHRRSP